MKCDEKVCYRWYECLNSWQNKQMKIFPADDRVSLLDLARRLRQVCESGQCPGMKKNKVE